MGPLYAGAIPVLVCLLPGVALLAVGRVISADLAARGRPGLNVLSSLTAVGVEVVALLVLVPRLGLIGAGLASTLGYAAQTLLCLLFYARVAQVRTWTPLLPTRDDRQVVRALGTLLVGWFRAASPGDRLRG